MTNKELTALMKSIGVKAGTPCVQYDFQTVEDIPNLPYLVWKVTADAPFSADNTIIFTISTITLELYTDRKDYALEGRVEEALDSLDLSYSKTPDDIDELHMHIATYTFQRIIDKED